MGYRLQLFAQITRDLLEQKAALPWAFGLGRRTQDGGVKHIVGKNNWIPLSKIPLLEEGTSWACLSQLGFVALGLSPQNLGQPCQDDSRHCPQHGTVRVSFHLAGFGGVV